MILTRSPKDLLSSPREPVTEPRRVPEIGTRKFAAPGVPPLAKPRRLR